MDTRSKAGPVCTGGGGPILGYCLSLAELSEVPEDPTTPAPLGRGFSREDQQRACASS
jgi:hypothetical protein